MRFVSRNAFVALLAVLGLSALGSASASAAECSGATETTTVLCAEGKAQFGTVPFKAAKTPSSAMALNTGGGLTVSCSGISSVGSFRSTSEKQLQAKALILKFTGCESGSKTACEVPDITSNELLGSFTGTGSVRLTGAKGGSSEVLFLVNIKSRPGQTCGTALENSPVSGAQECKLPGSTIEAVKHEMNCTTTGSALKWIGKVATLEADQEVSLTGAFSGDAWFLA